MTDFSIQTISGEQLDSLFDESKQVVPSDDIKNDIKHNQDTILNNIDNVDELFDDVNNNDPNKDDDIDKDGITKKDDKTSPTNVKVDEELIPETLKNTTKFLIEKGIWKDFDGSEELEFTEEVYAQLAESQAQERVSELFNELLDSTGEYGKAIISHVKNGGNPDEIIDLFKEQKQLEALDTTQEIPQKEIIEKYYSEIIGWKKEKIEKYISNLEGEDGALEIEAIEIKEKFDDLYKKQIVEIQKQQEKEKIRQENEQKEYVQGLVKEINSFEGFTDKEKKIITDSIIVTNHRLQDGTKVNNFYVKFQELQKDPKKYIELIHFVVDNEGYKEKIKIKEQADVTRKQWNFIKGNSAVSKKGTHQPDTSKNYSGFSFKTKK